PDRPAHRATTVRGRGGGFRQRPHRARRIAGDPAAMGREFDRRVAGDGRVVQGVGWRVGVGVSGGGDGATQVKTPLALTLTHAVIDSAHPSGSYGYATSSCVGYGIDLFYVYRSGANARARR